MNHSCDGTTTEETTPTWIEEKAPAPELWNEFSGSLYYFNAR